MQEDVGCLINVGETKACPCASIQKPPYFFAAAAAVPNYEMSTVDFLSPLPILDEFSQSTRLQIHPIFSPRMLCQWYFNCGLI